MVNEEHERQLIRNRLLGWSAAFEPVEWDGLGVTNPTVLTGLTELGRDLRLTAGPGGRDLARVRGLDNLAQALAISLTTLLGSDLFNTQFGFDGLNALVEETNPLLARERIRIAVIQVLRRDPRIRRIVDVKLEDGRLDLASSGEPAPEGADQDERRRSSRELEVRVAFETVSGDQAAVDLGRMSVNGE